jgi:hypothetical protein
LSRRFASPPWVRPGEGRRRNSVTGEIIGAVGKRLSMRLAVLQWPG